MDVIFVSGPGRGGTTLLMNILSSSKDVLVPNSYPIENKYIGYLDGMAECFASRPSDWFDASAFPSFKEWELFDIGKCATKLKTDMINSFVRSLDLQFPDKKYYAEKIWIRKYEYFSFKVKRIFLLRDPRSRLLSTIRFNQKRKFRDFAWGNNDDIVTFTLKQCDLYKQIQARIDQEKNALCLKYEDLICDLSTELGRIEEYLGIELNYAHVDKSKEQFIHHMTGGQNKESLTEWKKILPLNVLDLIDKESERFLTTFGYEFYYDCNSFDFKENPFRLASDFDLKDLPSSPPRFSPVADRQGQKRETYQKEDSENSSAMLKKLKKENHDINDKLLHIRSQLRDVLNSKSWKITSPLRKLMGFLMKMYKRFHTVEYMD